MTPKYKTKLAPGQCLKSKLFLPLILQMMLGEKFQNLAKEHSPNSDLNQRLKWRWEEVGEVVLVKGQTTLNPHKDEMWIYLQICCFSSEKFQKEETGGTAMQTENHPGNFPEFWNSWNDVLGALPEIEMPSAQAQQRKQISLLQQKQK